MPKFRRKSTIIEAEQWFPGASTPGVQLAPVDDEGFALSGPADPEGSFGAFVTTKQGEHVRITPGEWVIREPDESGYYPCHPDTFAELYEPIGDDAEESSVVPATGITLMGILGVACSGLIAVCSEGWSDRAALGVGMTAFLAGGTAMILGRILGEFGSFRIPHGVMTKD